jgi:hypothetical protein
MSRKIILTVAVLLGLCLCGVVLIEVIPYGRDHTNPPVVQEPAWDTPRTRELAKRACFDCHSNETTWPWYSDIAPISWLVQRDVDEGRQRLNFSEWTAGQLGEEGSSEIGGIVLEGEMPPAIYLIQHPDAALSASDAQALAQGLQNSLK